MSAPDEPFVADYRPTPEHDSAADGVEPNIVRLGHSKGGKERQKRLESFDFDSWDSLVWRVHLENILMGAKDSLPCTCCCHGARSGQGRHDNHICGYFKRRACKRWVLNFLTAVITALVAVAITALSRLIITTKFSIVGHLLDQEQAHKLPSGVAFATFLGIAVLLATLSAMMVSLLEPVAAGSGISEIKCLLNGVKLPRVVRFKTLVVKALGVSLSVASGLPVGKEGPMIHSGAVVAAGLSQGKSRTLGVPTDCTRVPDFRNDQEKRDFISCGAAAGVAAAFNAPVGGTLFALEEGSSFWSQALTWRAFACAMVSAYVINFFLSGLDGHWGKLSTLGMFSFGDFNSTGQNARPYVVGELVAFVLMGCLGGVTGAAFNWCNEKLTRWRMANVVTALPRIVEVAAVAAVTAVTAFLLPLLAGTCRSVPDVAAYTGSTVRFYCEAGQYNDVATFFFSPAEESIRMLFHFETGPGDPPAFGWQGLLLGWAAYSSLTCLTYGVAVPSGLFVPSLLTGAAAGRAVGEAMNAVLGAGSVDSGTYSLIGAAAVLGGMARMTISLAVILVECTGDLQYGLPLMLTLLSARWTGNLFNEGLYDIHIHLRHWPLLEEKPRKAVAGRLRVCDVMVTPVVQLCEVTSVRDALSTLESCHHNGFPVTFSAEALRAFPRFGNLAGIINRKHLTTLIRRRAFHRLKPPTCPEDVDGAAPPPAPAGLAPPRPPHAVWTSSDTAPAPDGEEDGDVGSPVGHRRAQPSAPAWELMRQGAYVSAAAHGRGHTAGAGPSSHRGPSLPRYQSASAVGARPGRTGRQGSRASLPGLPSSASAAVTPPPVVAAALAPMPAAGTSTDAASRSPVARTGSDASLNAARRPVSTGRGGPDARGRLGPGAEDDEEDDALFGPEAGAPAFAVAPAPDPASSAGDGPRGVAPVAEGAALFGLDYEGHALLPWADMERTYPRYPTAEDAAKGLSESDRDAWLDLRPYMNATPFTVHARAPLMRAYRLFRSMGLRHLVVVNDAHDVVGLLTRKDLLQSHLDACLRRKGVA